MHNSPVSQSQLPPDAAWTLRRCGIRPTCFCLAVSVRDQRMSLFELNGCGCSPISQYQFRRRYLISTSAYGIGQIKNSNQTPLGLHRVAQKIGAGHMIGTVFRSRKPIGLSWQGKPNGSIVHRILWLEGLEPGRNAGGSVDTFERYIYIHGFGDETTLGRPASHGCIHLAASDLIPLFDRLPVGTLVWIGER